MKFMGSAMVLIFAIASGTPGTAAETAASPATPDAALIEKLTGVKGQLDAAEGVFKVSAPRSDLSVTVAGSRTAPALGLTSGRRSSASARVRS